MRIPAASRSVPGRGAGRWETERPPYWREQEGPPGQEAFFVPGTISRCGREGEANERVIDPRPWRCMLARSRIRPRAPARCRSTRRPPTSSTTPSTRPTCSRSRCRETSTAGSGTRPGPCFEERVSAARGRRRGAGDWLRGRRRTPTPFSTSPEPATTSSRSRLCTAAPTTCSPTRCPSTASRCAGLDPDQPEKLAELVDDKTRLVFAETIGNPKLNVVDLDAWAEAAHEHGLPLIVDNTVPTPILCRAFDHGADVVVHSATKFIGGHGTSIGGVLVDSGKFDWTKHADRFPGLTKPDPSYHGVVWTEALGPAAFAGRARTVLLRNTGAALSPFNAFLFLQGLETLPLRIERHSAERARRRRAPRGRIRASAWVSYPGLESSPYKAVADRILTGGYGGLVSFGIKGGREAGRSSSRAWSCSATWPTSATPSRSRSTARPPPTRSSTTRSWRPRA